MTDNFKQIQEEELLDMTVSKKLSASEREAIEKGEKITIPNIQTEDGIKNAIVWKGEKDKEFKVKYLDEKIDLKVGANILNKPLDQEEVKELKNGNFIRRNDILLSVKDDKVVVKFDKVADIKKIGGYEIKPNDRALLSEGKSIGPLVLEGPHGPFSAKLRYDGNKLEFEGLKDLRNLNSQELRDLKEKLNKQEQTNIVSNVVGTVIEKEEKVEKVIAKEENKENKENKENNLVNDLKEALTKGESNKVISLANRSNFSNEDKKEIANFLSTRDEQDKALVGAIIKDLPEADKSSLKEISSTKETDNKKENNLSM